MLLDDIFSELDLEKRKKLLQYISQDDLQSFVTTTDLKNIQKKFLKNAQVFIVENGNITRK